MVVNQKMLELDNQLAALTTSRQALYDIVLGADRGNAKLVLHLDEARLQVDPLISKGIRYSVHAALTLVGSHYGGIDFDVVGRGYALGKSNSDILAIGSAAPRGAEVLAGKMSAACIPSSSRLPVYDATTQSSQDYP